MRRKLCFAYVLLLTFISLGFQCANASEPNWVWYYSSEYISDFYNPDSLKIIRDYNGNIDHVEIWIKTTYSQEGKEDTINSYELTNVPQIYELDSTLSKIYIYPRKRRILYQHEVFYDNKGNVLWSKEKSATSTATEVEVNSSNERYFSFISDLAFHEGQQIYFTKWKDGQGRWVYLDGKDNSDGSIERRWFDNMLMTLNGNQVSVWIWEEIRSDDVLIKKAGSQWTFDLSTQKAKIERVSLWSKEKDWYVQNEPAHSKWQSIIPGSQGEYWMETIKKYVDEHKTEIIENMHVK